MDSEGTVQMNRERKRLKDKETKEQPKDQKVTSKKEHKKHWWRKGSLKAGMWENWLK